MDIMVEIQRVARELIQAMTDVDYAQSCTRDIKKAQGRAKKKDRYYFEVKKPSNKTLSKVEITGDMGEIIQSALKILFSRNDWEVLNGYGVVIEEAICQFIEANGFCYPKEALSIINQVSSQYHESEVAYGKIVKPAKQIAPEAEFVTRIKFKNQKSNVKLIRKYLNMSDKEIGLLLSLDASELIGLSKNNPPDDNGVVINITGFMSWDFEVDKKPKFTYRNGQYHIPTPMSVREKKFIDKYRGCINNDSITDEELRKFINEASEQKHGTSIIIGPHEKMIREARRLCRAQRGNRVKISFKDNAEYIKYLGAIDGAVIVDENLNCLAVGVILDGEVKTSGDTARGARYNSIRNYIAWLKRRTDNKDNIYERCDCVVGIVLSEDKTVDVISSNDFGDIQGFNCEQLVFNLNPGLFHAYWGERRCDEEDNIPYQPLTDDLRSMIQEYQETISLVDIPDPKTKEKSTYMMINLLGSRKSKKKKEEDYRLILGFAELTFRKIGDGSCIFQILEVSSELQGGNNDLPKELYGKNAYRSIDLDNNDVYVLKLAYAFSHTLGTSVRFNAFSKCKDNYECDTIEVIKNGKVDADVAEELLNFERTRYVLRFSTEKEVFTYVFTIEYDEEKQQLVPNIIKEVLDQDFSEDNYEKIM